MGYGTQGSEHTGRHRIPPYRPPNGRSQAAEPDGDDRHPTGNWRARITLAGTDDRQRSVAQQTAALQERIERWLTVEGLHAEVGRIEPFDGRVTVIVTCSSRCKHRLRTAFPDLEVTSGDLRVAHCT
ncbi:hypothetical protein HY635_00180 [Candidatus Uhrbacteria bacterium]|nr:hypothetical protein [Candidatus Uhrbacteria bacterium]